MNELKLKMFFDYFFGRSYTVSKEKKPTFYSRVMKSCVKRKRDDESQQKFEIVEKSPTNLLLDNSNTKELSFSEQVRVYDRTGRVIYKRLKVDNNPAYFVKKNFKIELNFKNPFKSRAVIDNTYYYNTNETEFVSQEAEMTEDESEDEQKKDEEDKGEEIQSPGSSEKLKSNLNKSPEEIC